MKLLKAIIFAVMIVLSLGASGCYMDEVAVEPVVVYRSGFGYGYWYNNGWYAAPPGYVYSVGARPYWGPGYHYYRPGYSHGPYMPRPYYRGGYRGGYGGWHRR